MTTQLRSTIAQLVTQERYYRDTAQWKLQRSHWHPDASQTTIDISWFRGDVDGFIAASERQFPTPMASFHTLQPSEIVFSPDRTRCYAVTLISIHMRFSWEGFEFDLESWAHQVQRFVRLGDVAGGGGGGGGGAAGPAAGTAGDDNGDEMQAWKLVSFVAIYVSDRVSLPYPQKGAMEALEEVFEREQIMRTRSSYRCMKLRMALLGVHVRDDLPGYDDEDTWKPLMEAARQWVDTGKN